MQETFAHGVSFPSMTNAPLSPHVAAEILHWKHVASYFASCHAATLSGLPKKHPKKQRGSIVEQCRQAAVILEEPADSHRDADATLLSALTAGRVDFILKEISPLLDQTTVDILKAAGLPKCSNNGTIEYWKNASAEFATWHLDLLLNSPKSAASNHKNRLLSICKKAVLFIAGAESPVVVGLLNTAETIQAAIYRCNTAVSMNRE